MNMKYCKHCGEQIDADCVVCPKCGKQVEQLSGTAQQPLIINNSASSSASSAATVNSGPAYRPLPWYLRGGWIFFIGLLTGGIYWIIGIILRVMWRPY